MNIRDYYTDNFPAGKQNTLNKLFDESLLHMPSYGIFDPRHVIESLGKNNNIVEVRTLALELFDLLRAHGFITPDRMNYSLTDLGRLAKDNGGYNKYLESQKLEEKDAKEKSIAEIENLHLTNQINKFLYKTRWLPHILSILAFIISILSLYITLKPDTTDDTKNKHKTVLKEDKLLVKKLPDTIIK